MKTLLHFAPAFGRIKVHHVMVRPPVHKSTPWAKRSTRGPGEQPLRTGTDAPPAALPHLPVARPKVRVNRPRNRLRRVARTAYARVHLHPGD